MGGETIKVSLEGLNTFADQLVTFEGEVGSRKAELANWPPLLPGNDVYAPAKYLRSQFDAYRTSLDSALVTIHDDIDKIVVGLQQAVTKLGEGEHESLTAAQMMEILDGLPWGSAPPKIG